MRVGTRSDPPPRNAGRTIRPKPAPHPGGTGQSVRLRYWDSSARQDIRNRVPWPEFGKREWVAQATRSDTLPTRSRDDPPTGTAVSIVARRRSPLARTVAPPFPSGESPDGTGGSPVLPANHFFKHPTREGAHSDHTKHTIGETNRVTGSRFKIGPLPFCKWIVAAKAGAFVGERRLTRHVANNRFRPVGKVSRLLRELHAGAPYSRPQLFYNFFTRG